MASCRSKYVFKGANRRYVCICCTVTWALLCFMFLKYVLFWRRLTSAYCKCKIRLSEEISYCFRLHVCNADRRSSPSELPIFSYNKFQQEKTRANPCISSVVRGLCHTSHCIWGQAMKLCISPTFIFFPCAHSKLIVAFRKQLLDQKSYSKLFVSCFPRTDSEQKLLLSMQRFPSMDFLHVQWQDRCCYGLWSSRSSNNESALLLLRA